MAAGVRGPAPAPTPVATTAPVAAPQCDSVVEAEPSSVAAPADAPAPVETGSPVPQALTADEVQAMKVAELKAALKQRGLDQGGKKAQLVERLMATLA